MTKLLDIEGIGPVSAEKLGKAGVGSIEALLEQAGAVKGRKALAEKSGISEDKLLEWVNRADLMRVKGVGSEYSDLLEAAGVDSCAELANRKAENLLQKMTEVNAAKKLVRKLPTAAQVEDWVAQAKKLPKVVTH
jgi:predicted flap endonuclease-1-like 5' DNA nuclease